MKKLLAVLFVFALVMVGIFFFTLQNKTQPGNKSTTGVNTPKTKVIAGTVSVDQAISYQIAQEKGFFEKNNLAVTNVEVKGGAVEALLSGKIDFLVNHPLTPLSAKAEGADIQFIGLLENRYSYTIFSTMPASQVKKVGITRVGSGDHYSALVALQALKIDPSKIQFIPTTDTVGKSVLLERGEIDAMGLNAYQILTLNTPLPQTFRKLINIADNPGAEIATGVMTSGAFMKKSPQVAERFLKSLIEADMWAKNHPTEATSMLAKRNKIPPEAAKKVYEEYLKTAKDVTYITKPEILKPSIDAISVEKPTVVNVDLNTFINNESVESVLKTITPGAK